MNAKQRRGPLPLIVALLHQRRMPYYLVFRSEESHRLLLSGALFARSHYVLQSHFIPLAACCFAVGARSCGRTLPLRSLLRFQPFPSCQFSLFRNLRFWNLGDSKTVQEGLDGGTTTIRRFQKRSMKVPKAFYWGSWTADTGVCLFAEGVRRGVRFSAPSCYDLVLRWMRDGVLACSAFVSGREDTLICC